MQNSHEYKNTREETGDHHKHSNTKVLSRTTIANVGKVKTNTSVKAEYYKDKELINTGLHKLVSQIGSHKLVQKNSKLQANKKNNENKLEACASRIIPDRGTESRSVLNNQTSIDKYTMTDFEERNRPLDIETSVLAEPQTYKDLQWTDPRLLKKYQIVKQPFKKSMTIPCVNKSEYGSEVLETDDEETEILYSQNKHLFFKCLYYFCTASVSFIGSMCGITLITIILWKILDENILNFALEAPKPNTVVRRMITNVWGSIIHVINAIFGKIMRLLTMSTSEAFANEDESLQIWYQKLY